MPARIPARRPPTRPLSCHVCGSTRITVSDKAQMLSVASNVVATAPTLHRVRRKRLHAGVRCANGHEWWSRHPEALARSRAMDTRNRRARAADAEAAP